MSDIEDEQDNSNELLENQQINLEEDEEEVESEVPQKVVVTKKKKLSQARLKSLEKARKAKLLKMMARKELERQRKEYWENFNNNARYLVAGLVLVGGGYYIVNQSHSWKQLVGKWVYPYLPKKKPEPVDTTELPPEPPVPVVKTTKMLPKDPTPPPQIFKHTTEITTPQEEEIKKVIEVKEDLVILDPEDKPPAKPKTPTPTPTPPSEPKEPTPPPPPPKPKTPPRPASPVVRTKTITSQFQPAPLDFI